MTYARTDGRTTLVVKSLSRLKKEKSSFRIMAMFFETITIMKWKIFKNKATLLMRNLKPKVSYVITSVFS